MTLHAARMPWYREPWPWLLMAGPAAVVIAGVVTIYLAVVSNDGVVADDYYKRGLAINQTLSRDALARQRDYRAQVKFAANFSHVSVSFAGATPGREQLVLRLAHPGRPALDRVLPLTRVADNTHVAAFPALAPGRRQLTLEDSGQTWRLVGDAAIPGAGDIELAPR